MPMPIETASAAPVAPGASEVCDALDTDEDCDSLVDDDDDSVDPSGETSWYRDVDGDAYGIDSDIVTACDAPAGYAPVNGDCDDADFAIHPGGYWTR
jgi:hypothetical protein